MFSQPVQQILNLKMANFWPRRFINSETTLKNSKSNLRFTRYEVLGSKA